MKISAIDINFCDKKGCIATYLLPHSGGVILVDPGLESTLAALTADLSDQGFGSRDVTHILLTHIHLKHAGAAGWFAGLGAQVYVHPVGVPHMLNPEKLVRSASRLYRDGIKRLLGDKKPITDANFIEVQDDGGE
jgi:glyoxylase-like metal-dependent hydrolase (beta-lactamase superfamily II)